MGEKGCIEGFFVGEILNISRVILSEGMNRGIFLGAKPDKVLQVLLSEEIYKGCF